MPYYNNLSTIIDSTDLNLIEVGNAVNIQIAPIGLCMCNMHTSLCNESLTLKVGTIQIRQLLRLYPGSWLEAGSISVPELQFLRRHDQHSQRLHFLYNLKSQQTLNIPTRSTNLKRPSYVGLATNSNILSCACLGGSTNYYTLVQDDEKIFYLFDFCGQQKQSYEQYQNINDNPLRRGVHTDLYPLSRANLLRNLKHKSVIE
ncbi:unnamed protein product [Adineta steineri]|uniref:Uncharacterized protein n=1 Tax=Adineta steineri TaxID=433720 RepID=A0A819PYN6_9BILA|nr:unnamed protein product [Adineta steineri]CAF4018464.1 unnamed protein product [Adineta steineri]